MKQSIRRCTLPKVATIIPAGGCGSFDGGQTPKVLEPLYRLNSFVLGEVINRALHAHRIGRRHDPTLVVVENDYKFRGRVSSKLKRESFARSIRFAHQASRTGSGKAVEIGLEQLEPDDDYVLVIFSDMPLWRPVTIARLIDRTINHGADVGLVAIEITDDLPPEFHRFGRVLRDPNGNVMAIYEPRDADDPDFPVNQENLDQARWINPSLFCFRTEWLRDRIRHIPPDQKRDDHEREYNLSKVLIAPGPRPVIVDIPLHRDRLDEARGINTPRELALAKKIAARQIIEA